MTEKIIAVTPWKIICSHCGSITYTRLDLYPKESHMIHLVNKCKECLRERCEND